MKNYKGTIIQESLIDDRILNDFDFVGFKVTNEEKPEARWHLFTVFASHEDIEKLASNLKPEKWYAHFWSGDDVIAVYPSKTFQFKISDKSTMDKRSGIWKIFKNSSCPINF